MLEALIESHASDPELDAPLDSEVPHRTAGAQLLQLHLRNALRLALSARAAVPAAPLGLERTLFVVTHLLGALAHGAISCC